MCIRDRFNEISKAPAGHWQDVYLTSRCVKQLYCWVIDLPSSPRHNSNLRPDVKEVLSWGWPENTHPYFRQAVPLPARATESSTGPLQREWRTLDVGASRHAGLRPGADRLALLRRASLTVELPSHYALPAMSSPLTSAPLTNTDTPAQGPVSYTHLTLPTNREV